MPKPKPAAESAALKDAAVAAPRAGAKRHTFVVTDQVSEHAERSGIERRTEPGDAPPAIPEPEEKE